MLQRAYQWLVNIPLTNPVERKQAPTVQVFVIGLSIAAALWMPLPFFAPATITSRVFSVVAALLVIIVNIAALVILRRGAFAAAVLTSALGLIAGLLLVLTPWGLKSGYAMLPTFALPIALVGLLTSRRESILTVALSSVGVLAVGYAERYVGITGFAPLQGDLGIITIGTFLLTLGVLYVLIDRFGTTLRVALVTAEQREAELSEIRASLESTVQERTASLAAALHKVEQRETTLVEALASLQNSQDAIRELSAPILPVLPKVLIAPIIGALDSSRAALLTNNVLQAVERSKASYVVLDITGMPVVDTQVAQVLLQLTAAVRLLGAKVLLVGVRPEVAQTVVSLGVDLSAIERYSDLQSAIATFTQRVATQTTPIHPRSPAYSLA